jgi:phenazine biosynthesis protein phzE
VLADGTPLLSICLGHQVLAGLLGLPPRRRPVPAQGERREIDLFGRTERVGFYNTFAAYSDADTIGAVEVSRDRYTTEVHALRGPRLWSLQFHPESILTEDGPRILSDVLSSL